MTAQGGYTLLQPSDPRWMDFIQTCQNANIFHHPAWMELMQACYGYSAAVLALTNNNGTIRAGIPLMHVRIPFVGRHWVSLPFSDYCVPLWCDDEIREYLTDELVKFFKGDHKGRIEIRWELPRRTEIQQVSPYVLHTIKLNPDPAQISRHFKRTHLQNIHTAEERGVKVVFGDKLEHLKIFYDIQLETRKRHGVPAQPWKYFELLWQHIVKAGMGFTLLALKDSEYIAGMVYLAWGRTLIAKYAASREDSFNLRPNNLLFWEGIRWGCTHGFEVFDMGRTELENSGLRNFKSRWGAVEEPLVYSFLSSKIIQPPRQRLVNLLHFIIRNSPVYVCRLMGEFLYKYAG